MNQNDIESINLIIERSNGSRNHLKKELEKIYTYALNKKTFLDLLRKLFVFPELKMHCFFA